MQDGHGDRSELAAPSGCRRLRAGVRCSEGVCNASATLLVPFPHSHCTPPFTVAVFGFSRGLQVEELSPAAQAIIGRHTGWAAKEAAADVRVSV